MNPEPASTVPASNTFAVRLFGPALPPTGTRASLAFVEGAVRITAAETRQDVPVNSISLREVGVGAPGIELSWAAESERWAAHIDDPAQARAITSHPALTGSAATTRLRTDARRSQRARLTAMLVVALLVLGPLLLLFAFLLEAERIASWIADRIPIEQEVALGDASFDAMRGSLKLIENGAAFEAVKTLGARLTQDSRYTYRFHLADDETPNAFAVPGGIVVIHTGLIAATQRPEELAGVLAHEVQHVEQRHSLENLIKHLGLTALWPFATGDLGGGLAGQVALELTGLHFSRDAEREADEKGFDALMVAGIDPSGLADFFMKLSELGGDAPTALISTHPPSEDRAADLRRRREALAGRPFAPLNLGNWPPR